MIPTNRLEIFLAMIAGREDVEPIMPKTRLEYWLNEVAGALGGNPWIGTPELKAREIYVKIQAGVTPTTQASWLTNTSSDDVVKRLYEVVVDDVDYEPTISEISSHSYTWSLGGTVNDLSVTSDAISRLIDKYMELKLEGLTPILVIPVGSESNPYILSKNNCFVDLKMRLQTDTKFVAFFVPTGETSYGLRIWSETPDILPVNLALTFDAASGLN